MRQMRKRGAHKQRHKLREYLRRKKRSLTPEESAAVRNRLENGDTNVYKLAKDFGCVPTQIAGVKAWLKR
jgi:DNA invertase Pin-like site-specific DNA recombinase